LSILIPLVGLVGALALVAELILIIGREFLSGGQQVAALKESIRKTQSELRAADKKLDSLRTNRRGAAKELEAAIAKLEEIEQQSRRAPESPPVLLYLLGQPGDFGRRFRAKITKTVPAEADEGQALLWKHESLVEIVTDTADEARREALRHFPEANGYALGPFTEMREAANSAA
jgi:hypothetical protein